MLRIYLTGEICLTLQEAVVRIQGNQGRVVFAFLVTERGREVSRDELSETLWPQHLPAASEVALSAIVSKLRAALTEVGLGRECIRATSRSYQFAPPVDSWIDTEAAIESVHLAEAALLAGKPRPAYGPAVVACAILARSFLHAEEGTWVDRRREELRKARLRALDCLAQIHTDTGEHSLALRAAEEAVYLEPYREAGYQRLMLIHHAIGNRAEAMRVYAQLEALLEQDLGTSPSHKTRSVLEAVTGKAAG